MDCILQNALCVTLAPPSVEMCDLRIAGGSIAERSERIVPAAEDEVHDLNGMVVMPGLVCAHTHLYSSLSRGMPPAKRTPSDFPDILEQIWWKLDRALDEESLYYSALAGALDAVKCGTTTLIDHHASPGFIGGSLDVIKEAIEKVGLRGVLCYEVTDRGGMAQRDEGLSENERFIRANQSSALFRGMVGAHASFTLSNESLGLCSELAQDLQTGVHIHAAEDVSDVEDAQRTHRCGVMDRFLRYGIVREGSILAHCIHLTAREIERAKDAGCMLVHNPRSNMNNRVGYAPVQLFGERGALGTDGFPADMFEEAGYGFFKQQDAMARIGRQQVADIPGRTDAPGDEAAAPGGADMTQLLQGGQRAASEQFGRAFGTLDAGSVADLIVLDYQSPTPMKSENCGGHFLFGMRSSMVDSVMIGGKWVMKNRIIGGIDTVQVYERSRRAAEQLWERMQRMP